MNLSSEFDDKPVEQALRDILDPLDRQLARLAVFFPLALVTIVPLFFFALWLGLELSGRRALVMSAGVCCGLVALHLSWEILFSRQARRRFDQRFPPGTASRGLALRILGEMHTPSKAEEKLRTALSSSSPERIVRHRPQTADPQPETLVFDQATLLVSPSPLPPAIQVQAGNGTSAPEPPAPSRPGGYYDYIPLEPRSHADVGSDEKRA